MEQPPIRILQRPCPIQPNQSTESNRPPIAVKTLEQREADYAAARRRIMGSESPEPEPEPQQPKGTNKHVIIGNGSGDTTTLRHTSTGVTTSATPLMSIQATPVATSGMLSDFRISNASISGTTAQPTRNVRQGLAVVNVAQKLQQQQPQTTTTGPRQMLQPPQKPQRILTASASSPSILSPNSRASQPLPLFHSHVGNAALGLLPTPPGFNYSAQNASLNTGGLHSQSAALALMHHFAMLQQYQQALNGFHNQLISPIASNVSHNSFNHLNFPSISSQSGINPKNAHPPTFN